MASQPEVIRLLNMGQHLRTLAAFPCALGDVTAMPSKRQKAPYHPRFFKTDLQRQESPSKKRDMRIDL